MSIKEISKELIKAFTTNNKRLSKLDLSKNQIKVIQNLNELKHLQILNLADNQIEQIDGLQDLALLQEINLRHNLITQVKNLKNLKYLEVLDLSFNRLNDIKDLQELKHNKNLKELNVQGNANITQFYDYKDQIKKMIPQIQKIDGQFVNQQYLQSVSQEVIEQQSIETYKNIISTLQSQVQTQNPLALEQWRNKCFELLQREKIMNYRFNQLELSYSKDQETLKQNLKEQVDRNEKLSQDLLLKQEEILQIQERLEQTKQMFDNQMKNNVLAIYNQFEKQMNLLQEQFNAQIKSQQKRFFALEGTILQQKTKIMQQKKSASSDFIEFKQSLKSIIKAHAQKDILADISSEEFVNEIERIIRDSLIQLGQNQFKSSSSSSRFEIKQLEEEISSLNQQKKNLQTLLQEQEETLQKINRNNEQKLKELLEELEFKTRKVKEQNQNIYELEQKLDKETQEKQNSKQRLNELIENSNIEVKRKIDEATSKLKSRIDELEKENFRLASGLNEKDLEASQFIENINKKLQQAELEKVNEISALENKLRIETEKKNMFSNQCNDMMRIINMKENKIRAIKDEQRLLQEKLNQTMNHELVYNQTGFNNMNNRANLSHNDIYSNYQQQLINQNQRTLQNQNKQNMNNNQYDFKNYHGSTNPLLNQTDIQYNYKQKLQQQNQQQQQSSQEDWSPIQNKGNLSYNPARQPFKQTNKNQEINNFTTNKANMILNDLSIIQNEHPGADTLEDELKKLEQNELFAQEILNDNI
ncbi:hypothetical protein TTHERM_00641090 (macronuclear) [Tetrahymena thermophila SB210]|uniref:Uncharacterized protein n=1 Tax=Tetrahymena thermophila (strain SB210) TaxID=312017 RepID=Q23F23_TETTS|nr:hypothetical protein TTHERM_00641090 [Tetrahymena thermophila SB210]EAR95082.1 hypothetical protein TTHERM_00641090 [Tetrahymena thermophila SB210]|eukprot:XP_001015327.1 hypothetical protein TTHERM_00641090 [Tetrahymena thermophila SB210]